MKVTTTESLSPKGEEILKAAQEAITALKARSGTPPASTGT